MSSADVRKLRPGDIIRLKATGHVITVTGIELSGRLVYARKGKGEKLGNEILTLKNTEVRKEIK